MRNYVVCVCHKLAGKLELPAMLSFNPAINKERPSLHVSDKSIRAVFSSAPIQRRLKTLAL